MNRKEIRSNHAIMKEQALHANEQVRRAEAVAQQTIYIILGLVESYFGERLPQELLAKVETVCHALVYAHAGTSETLTWGKMKFAIDEQVRLHREEQAAKKAQAEAVLAAGGLVI